MGEGVGGGKGGGETWRGIGKIDLPHRDKLEVEEYQSWSKPFQHETDLCK